MKTRLLVPSKCSFSSGLGRRGKKLGLAEPLERRGFFPNCVSAMAWYSGAAPNLFHQRISTFLFHHQLWSFITYPHKTSKSQIILENSKSDICQMTSSCQGKSTSPRGRRWWKNSGTFSLRRTRLFIVKRFPGESREMVKQRKAAPCLL